MAVTVQDIKSTLGKITGSPVGLGLMLGGATWAGSKLLYPKVTEALSLIGTKLGGEPDDPQAKAEAFQNAQEAYTEMNSPGSTWKTWLPVGLGAAAFAAGTLPFLDTRDGGAPYYGAFTWKRPILYRGLNKNSSLYFDPNLNDQTQLDVQKLEPVNMMRNVVLSDPTMPAGVQSNMLNIIDGAQKVSPNKTTLGGIFDSARNVIEENLTVGGVASGAIRALVGMQGGKIVANALDTMIGLSPSQRTNIQLAGMVTNAVAPLFIDYKSGF